MLNRPHAACKVAAVCSNATLAQNIARTKKERHTMPSGCLPPALSKNAICFHVLERSRSPILDSKVSVYFRKPDLAQRTEVDMKSSPCAEAGPAVVFRVQAEIEIGGN